MRKLILLWAVGVLLTGLVGAENCTVAYPMMEVLKCEKQDSFTHTEYFACSDAFCTINYPCISECEVNLHIECGAFSRLEGQIKVNGEFRDDFDIIDIFSVDIDLDDVKAGDGEEITIEANCERFWTDYPVAVTKSYAIISDVNKYLYADNHEWSSHKLSDTKNCIPQSRASNFVDKQISSGNLPKVYQEGGTDALGNQITPYPADYNFADFDINSELKVGDTLSYFYRWESVPNINLRYDKDKKPVYCGGSSDQRKLINYKEVNTNDGECFYVPSSLKRNVECCLDGDCHFSNELCGPDFICTDKKPCNGVYDCGTEEGSCSNNQKSWWDCKTSSLDPANMPNGETFDGWCQLNSKQVKCCPGNCQAGYHCVEDIGCEKDIRAVDCPAEKCCFSGGSYKEKQCGGNLECCALTGSFVGLCAEDCSQISEDELESLAGITGRAIGSGSSAPGIAILIIFVVLIGGAIYFFYFRKSQTQLISQPTEKQETTTIAGKHCTGCGGALREGSGFCTKCGAKIRKV
ncbi:MAG: hypothetical protein KJ600_04880 [Nanoarchaeota archaeon]|nr:hypothetical protein [Nanoarchaeota archaeon]MBU1103864.1 hypothetical protein [Nanoarchaeota archaeon]